jgi:hypothetical protein
MHQLETWCRWAEQWADRNDPIRHIPAWLAQIEGAPQDMPRATGP